MTPKQIFEMIKLAGERLAKRESLPLKSITAGGINSRGLCTSDGRIYLILRASQDMLEEVKIHETARDMCHELAHLKHFNHSEAFWEYQAYLCHEMSDILGRKIIPERSVRVSPAIALRMEKELEG